MFKFKAILFTMLLVFSVSSITYAAELSNPAKVDVEVSISPNLLNSVVSSEEIDVHYRDYLDAGMILDFQPEPETYKVVEGDNLYRIALMHDISLETLLSWNDLRGDIIHPDDELIVSGGNEETKHVNSTDSSNSIVSKQDKVVAVAAPVITSPSSAPEGKELVVTATAYTAYCEGCSGTTAYGIDLRANPNLKVIAVDPNIIPLGTRVWVEGYGEAIAGDTGGAIKGNRIDVFIPSYENALAWGVKDVKIRVLN